MKKESKKHKKPPKETHGESPRFSPRQGRGPDFPYALPLRFSSNGFTLLELLLYLAIVPFILLSISTFFFSLPEARVKNQTLMEVEEQGAHVMNLITQTIRNAEAITAPTSGGSAISLLLDVPNATDDPTLFDISNSTLRITEGVQSPILLTNTRVVASDLTFQNLSRPNTPGIVRVQFTLRHVNSEGRYEYNYEKTFYGSASVRQ